MAVATPIDRRRAKPRTPAPAAERGGRAALSRRTPPVEADPPPMVESAGADGGALTERAAAALTSRLLQPGETIVLLLKPSPLFIVLAPLGTLIAIGLLTAIAVVAGDAIGLSSSQQRGLAGVGVSLLMLRLAWQFLEWLSRLYVLTDQRLVRQQGVLRVNIFECPLSKVQHTDLALSLRERLTGLGTIAFSTAGTGGIDAVWHMIARPMEVHQTVIEALRRYRR